MTKKEIGKVITDLIEIQGKCPVITDEDEEIIYLLEETIQDLIHKYYI